MASLLNLSMKGRFDMRIPILLMSAAWLLLMTQPGAAQSYLDQQNSAAYVGFHLKLPFSPETRGPGKSFKLGFRAGFWRDIMHNRYGVLRSSFNIVDLAELSFSSHQENRVSFSVAGVPVMRRDAFGQIIYLDPDKEGEKGTGQSSFLKWAGITLGAATIFSFVVADAIKDDLDVN